MYDVPGVEADVDRLWQTVAEQVGANPVRLRPDALHQHWQSGSYLLSQTCGFPLIDSLPDVSVVGVFTTNVGEGDGSRYRSVIIAPLHDCDGPVAVNGWDSLSGYASLALFLSRERPDLLARAQTSIVVTGGHWHSVAAVASGAAAMASIDAVTFDILSRIQPSVVARVCVVGRGPLVPCLPLITPSDEHRARLRIALHKAVSLEPMQPSLRRLGLSGFVALDRTPYLGLAKLIAFARELIPPQAE